MTIAQFIMIILINVESSGNIFTISKTCDGIGPLQINPVVVADVNRIMEIRGFQTRFDLHDRQDIYKSYAMARIYLEYYVNETRLGRPVTIRDFAVTWNGGPSAVWVDPETQKGQRLEQYWQKCFYVYSSIINTPINGVLNSY